MIRTFLKTNFSKNEKSLSKDPEGVLIRPRAIRRQTDLKESLEPKEDDGSKKNWKSKNKVGGKTI